MNVNRRSFFQVATLSTVAVLQSKGQVLAPENKQPEVSLLSVKSENRAPVEVDLAEPGAAEYVGRSATDLFVRLEEEFPGDPGELSGAVLRIIDSGERLRLCVTIGDTLQPYGDRTSHWLAYLDAEDAMMRVLLAHEQVAAIDPINGEREPTTVFLNDPHCPDRWGALRLVVHAGDSPELHLCASRNCLGVLRGDLFLRFFDCLRKRCALGGVETL